MKLSKKKTALFAAIVVVIALFFLEAFASWALMLRLRIANNQNFTKSEPTYFSLINIPYEAAFGLFDQSQAATKSEFEYRIDAGGPIYEPDADLGYKPLGGKYRVTFSRRPHGGSKWERLRVNVTFNSDGTRWTGECQSTGTNVYIFGDSWVAGHGVNDEQTFAF